MHVVLAGDKRYYQRLADFESRFAYGPPSLVACEALKVSGKVSFEAGVICEGRVPLVNPSPETRNIRAGKHRDVTRQL